MADKSNEQEASPVITIVLSYLFTGILLLLLLTVTLAMIPTEVSYTHHGTGTYVDVALFELGREPGLWDYGKWDHLHVENVIIHHGEVTHKYYNVTGFRDSYNPYHVTEICDDYHKFEHNKTKITLFKCPIADGEYEYYPENETLEYWIDDRFRFSERVSGEVIII